MPAKPKFKSPASILRELAKIGDIWDWSDPSLQKTFEGVAPDLLRDTDFFRKAVLISPASFYFADASAKEDKSLILAFLSDQAWKNKSPSSPWGFWFAGFLAKSRHKTDVELLLATMQRWPLRTVSSPSSNRADKADNGFESNLPSTRQFWLDVAKSRSWFDYVELLPRELAADREIHLLFFLKNPPAFLDGKSDELNDARDRINAFCKEREFVADALLRDPGMVTLFNGDSFERIKDILLTRAQIEQLLTQVESPGFCAPSEKIFRTTGDYSISYQSSFDYFVRKALHIHNDDSELATRAIRALISKFGTDPLRLRDIFQALSPKLLNDRKFFDGLLRTNGMLMQYASDDLRSDKETVQTAVSNDGMALKFASESLKDDEQIVTAAVSQNGSALDNASLRLQQTESLAMLALQNGLPFRANLPGLPSSFATKANVVSALKQNGGTLLMAPKELCCDRDVVLAALQFWRGWGELATTTLITSSYNDACGLLDDREIVLAALAAAGRKVRDFKSMLSFEHNPYAYASPRVKADRSVLLEAVRVDGESLGYAPDHFRQDKEIILAALTSPGRFRAGDKPVGPVYRLIPEEMKNDKEVTMTALRHAGPDFPFQEVPSEFWSDDEAVLAALSSGRPPSDFWKLVKSRAKEDLEVAFAKIQAG
jgi:hypothetical protein